MPVYTFHEKYMPAYDVICFRSLARYMAVNDLYVTVYDGK